MDLPDIQYVTKEVFAAQVEGLARRLAEFMVGVSAARLAELAAEAIKGQGIGVRAELGYLGIRILYFGGYHDTLHN